MSSRVNVTQDFVFNDLETYEFEEGVLYRVLDFMGYPKYKVGDDGTVWSRSRSPMYGDKKGKPVSWRKLKPAFTNGYPVVSLCKDGTQVTIYIYKLVLFAFVGSPDEGMQCCHGDGDRANSCLENLRWDAQRSNFIDRVNHGNLVIPIVKFGEDSSNSRLSNVQVLEIRRLFATGRYMQKDLAARFGINPCTVSQIVNRKRWVHLQDDGSIVEPELTQSGNVRDK